MHVVTIVGVVAAYALVFMAAICLIAEKGIHPLRRSRRKFAKLSFFAKLIVMVFSVRLFVHGSLKSPTNDPPRSVPVVQQIAEDDIAHGFVLANVSTNSQFSLLNSQFPIDCQITTNLKWKLRGAYEDWFTIRAVGWRFPFRDGWMDEPAICAWGEVRPSIGETNVLPPIVPYKVSLVPEANSALIDGNGDGSIFWHHVSPSNGLILTWQNALVERCPTNLISFQAEFFADGRFEYRRQEDGSQSVVVESYMPILSFDYDGDGLENSVDPEPYAAGPDAHGTNAKWYNAVCSNVLDAVEGDEPNEPEITWKDGINTNAYYFVDVVASRGPAAIWFAANATNNLGNPVLVALTAATNHVPLLMGVDYAVTATADFEIIPPDGGFVEISTNNEGKVHVKWPVDFYAMQNGGSSYYVEVSPADPGGEFVWDGAPPMRGGTRSSSSCLSSAFGPYVSFDCGDNCGCGGCYATGTYRYEGLTFGLPVLQCGCTGGDSPSDPVPTPIDGPVSNVPPSVSATARAVIFEDRYESAPGVWADKRSSSVVITLSVEGGTDGGTLVLSTQNMDKLNRLWGHTLPSGSVSVPAGYTMEWICAYEGKYVSDVPEDIMITAIFTPNDPEASSMMDVLSLTSVRVETQTNLQVPEPRSRKTIGVVEAVDFIIMPSSILELSLSTDGGRVNQESLQFIAGETEKSCTVQVNAYDAQFSVPFNVVEPHGYLALWVGAGDAHGELVSTNAGNFSATIFLTVMPTNVSFMKLEFMEKGMPSTDVVGYFTNSWCSSWVTHVGNGADEWFDLKNGNQWEDRVGMPPLPLPWGDGGSFSWPIPNLWRVSGSSNVVHELPHDPSHDQIFQLDADGTSRILKHRCRIQRKRGDLYNDPDAFILEGGIE